jgi:hypothetical protein
MSPRSRKRRLGLKERLYTIEATPWPNPFWWFSLKIYSRFILISESARILHFYWSREHFTKDSSRSSFSEIRILLSTFMALPKLRRLVLLKRRETRLSVRFR